MSAIAAPYALRRRSDVASQVPLPRIVLAAGTSIYVVFFGTHLYWRHSRFGTFDYDLGIWDQYAWGIANGETFNTIRGLDAFAFHISPGMALFAPFYWLGAGSGFLNLFMVVVVAAGVVPIFRVASDRLGNQWQAVVLAFAYLAHYVVQWSLWETFHPEVVAITPLLFAWEAALSERWRAMFVWFLAALIWKEDVALAVAAFGVVLAYRRHWRIAATTVVLGLAWFLVATRLLIPALSPGGQVFYEDFYGYLGDDPVEMAGTAVTDPTQVYRQLERANAIGYARDVGAPYGFTSLLSPIWLLVGLPQYLANLLSTVSNSWPSRVHYAALPFVGATIAMVHGVSWPKLRPLRPFLVGWVGAFALATSAAWGISIFSVDYRDGFWPLVETPAVAQVQGAVDITPEDAVVSGTYNVVPHLTHREAVYTFPNPWSPSNWGIADEDPPDPGTVMWLVIDRRVMDDAGNEMLADILADGWTTVYDDGAGFVATRDPDP